MQDFSGKGLLEETEQKLGRGLTSIFQVNMLEFFAFPHFTGGLSTNSSLPMPLVETVRFLHGLH